MLKGFNYPLTPKGNSTLNPPPPWYYSADFLSIEFWSDPAAVTALLPSGLDPDPSASGHGHAQLLGVVAVEIHFQLGDVDLVVGEGRTEFGCLRRLGQEGFQCVVQGTVSKRSAVFDLELEATEGAQAEYGRWWKHGDERTFYTGILFIQRRSDRPG